MAITAETHSRVGRMADADFCSPKLLSTETLFFQLVSSKEAVQCFALSLRCHFTRPDWSTTKTTKPKTVEDSVSPSGSGGLFHLIIFSDISPCAAAAMLIITTIGDCCLAMQKGGDDVRLRQRRRQRRYSVSLGELLFFVCRAHHHHHHHHRCQQ